MPLRFLLLDDNPDDRMLARRELERHFPGCAATEAGEPAGFERVRAAGFPFDVVVTDFQMRWTTGLDVLKVIKARDAELPVIMFTATGTQEIAVEAMKHGLDDYVVKSPRHYARLPVAVRTCLDRAEIRARAIRSETRLASLLENIQLGVFRLSLGGALEDGNRAFWSMLGLAPGDAAGAGAHSLFAAVRDCLPRLAATLDAAELHLPEGAANDAGAAADSAADARVLKVKLVRVRVNGHDAIDGIVEDVTSLARADLEIKRLNTDLERRIAERTRQLQEANEALETFGFSVSHDMREPLRTIQGYALALRQDFDEGRLDNARTFIGRIETVAGRVDGMVTDLLEFARLSRAEIATEAVPVAVAMEEVKAMLHADPAFARAELTRALDAGMAVRAHRQTLVQALANLVSNAVKFVGRGTTPRVEVTAVRTAGGVRITVRDNGIGIAPAAHARIFNVFERLHSEEEFPGTGIGLAIVKKGVERMGGGVAVDSQPGAGSSFHIVLPAACEDA